MVIEVFRKTKGFSDKPTDPGLNASKVTLDVISELLTWSILISRYQLIVTLKVIGGKLTILSQPLWNLI
jgi:hypothetical protein